MNDTPWRDLFPIADSWLPGEILYSLASRHHLVSGNILAAQTCVQLFGHSRLGCSHDLPAQLHEFVKRTEGVLGTANDIARYHTILPYYFPYRPSADAANAMATVCSGGIGSLKARLGLLATRLGASPPLKACRSCMAEDLDRFHIAYWHLEHQYPGVWICRRHRRILDRALGKVNGEGRFYWYLPCTMTFVPGLEGMVSESNLDLLDAAGEFSQALGCLEPGFHLDSRIITEVYRSQLVDLGLADTNSRLRQRAFAQTVLPVSAFLSRLIELHSLPSTEAEVHAQFLRLIHGPRSHAHPMRHCVLVIALFGSWPVFLTKYKDKAHQIEKSTLPSETPVDKSEEFLWDGRRTQMLNVLKEGATVTAAAHVAGVAVATAMVWASAGGFQVSRRPKKLSPKLRALVIQKLALGKSKRTVAQSMRFSIQTITLILRSEPGLTERWNQARFARTQRIARRLWERAARNLDAPTAKLVRLQQPAAFAWLYRHDRAWLDDHASRLKQFPRSNNANVRWDERDQEMAQAVRVAALSLHAQQPGRPIKLAELCNTILQLKARLSKIDRLPLTRTAINDVTRRRPKI